MAAALLLLLLLLIMAASSSSSSNQSLLLLLLVSCCWCLFTNSSSYGFSLATPSPSPSSTTLIEESCKKTEYPDVCISSLESDPRSFDSDFKGLTRISIENTNANATNIVKYITDFIGSGSAVAANYSVGLRICQEMYESSIRDLVGALDKFDQGAYEGAASSVGGANGGIWECNTGSINHDFDIPKSLTDKNVILLNLLSITIKLLTILGGGL